KGEGASLTVFKDKAGADESVRLAADYVKEHLSKLLTQKPEIIEGPIKAHDLALTNSAKPVGAWLGLSCGAPGTPRSKHLSTGRLVRSLVSLWREIVFEDDAVFHHEDDFLDRIDILRRIAVDGDNVGKFAGLDRADPIGPVQQFRAS